ncbi:MAG: nucleotidyltransferase family protein [Acetobacteraceae bacterium]
MRPLGSRASAWLLHLADPQCLVPAPPGAPPWDEAGALLEAASAHGVLPAVLRALGQASRAAGGAGAAALAAWRERLAVQAGFGLLLSHHAARVLPALAEAGIGATLVKGATFARRVYPDPGLRGFTDLDILVAQTDRARAGEVLARLGFVEEKPEYRGDADYAEEKWLLAADRSVMVELHGDLVHNPRLRRALHLDRAAVLAAGGGDAEDAAALLLVAAVHGATSHQFDRLQHVVDVLLLGRRAAGAVDAARLARVAEGCGARPALGVALLVAARVFGDAACATLARQIGVGAAARLGAALVSPGVVLRAPTEARGRDSWRRKALRELLSFRG